MNPLSDPLFLGMVAGTGGGGGPTDPDFASVSLLLSMDGTNGSTTFVDTSSNAFTVTAFDIAQISTADPKFGTGELTLSGNGDYLQTPANPAFAFGTGDFTVEGWAKPDNVGGNFGLFTFDGQLFLSIFVGSWFLGTAGSGGLAMGSVTSGVKVHFAVTRSGTSLRLFVEGTQLGSTLTNTADLTSNQLFIGYYFAPRFGFIGTVDEFRVTKGIARYTANFTPPTAPFPTS